MPRKITIKESPDELVSTMMRIPGDVHKELAKIAEYEMRPLNSVVVAILRDWIANNPDRLVLPLAKPLEITPP